MYSLYHALMCEGLSCNCMDALEIDILHGLQITICITIRLQIYICHIFVETSYTIENTRHRVYKGLIRPRNSSQCYLGVTTCNCCMSNLPRCCQHFQRVYPCFISLLDRAEHVTQFIFYLVPELYRAVISSCYTFDFHRYRAKKICVMVA